MVKKEMGQYYYVVNLDKRQYIHPHVLGDGLKLMEFACSTPGTMTALAVLLADGNGRGGGDLMAGNDPKNIIGSWAGDRIVIAGDYADGGKWGVEGRRKDGEPQTLHEYAEENFTDISKDVLSVIIQDGYVYSEMYRAGVIQKAVN